MSRRFAAPVLLSAVLVGSLAGVATGADPDVVDRPPRTRHAGPSRGVESPKVRSGLSPQTAPGANGRIAFARSPYLLLPNVIWSMASNGSDQLQLTPEAGPTDWGDLRPAYSPGGTMIAFTREVQSGNDPAPGDIFVMQANGTGVKRLTTAAAYDGSPDWTPDGSRLVFTSDRSGGGDIYSMAIDGSDVRRLTTHPEFDSYPTVSPDGTRIAFASERDGRLDVYTMNIDGSGVTRLTTDIYIDYYPDWSPDGSKIAFTSLRTGEAEIFSMNANGSGQVNLTNDAALEDFEPSWSPDGTMIAFWSYANEADSDVYVMPSNGGSQTAVGATVNDEWAADWQPIPEFPLIDARFSPFESYIKWVYEEGITSGCSSERYCPGASVTRAEMASFLARALHLSGPAPDAFTDDETSIHEVNINLVAREGIASGCGTNLFCPSGLVKRDQMASFLSRALDLSGPAPNAFSDDNGNLHEVNINLVAREGIASGCGANLYCPSANVTRGQMAAFLYRAFAP